MQCDLSLWVYKKTNKTVYEEGNGIFTCTIITFAVFLHSSINSTFSQVGQVWSVNMYVVSGTHLVNQVDTPGSNNCQIHSRCFRGKFLCRLLWLILVTTFECMKNRRIFFCSIFCKETYHLHLLYLPNKKPVVTINLIIDNRRWYCVKLLSI